MLFNGEPSITVHLSYYAELRAAMAFLCTEGILIANNEQACIDSSNNIYIPSCQPKSMRITRTGTHSATWDIINEWILNSTKQTNVLEYFTYKGRTFKELISFIPHAANTNSGQVALVKNGCKHGALILENMKKIERGGILHLIMPILLEISLLIICEIVYLY